MYWLIEDVDTDGFVTQSTKYFAFCEDIKRLFSSCELSKLSLKTFEKQAVTGRKHRQLHE